MSLFDIDFWTSLKEYSMKMHLSRLDRNDESDDKSNGIAIFINNIYVSNKFNFIFVTMFEFHIVSSFKNNTKVFARNIFW